MNSDNSLDDLICTLKNNMADTYYKITDVQAEYAKKQHTHSINDITSLSDILSGKADNILAKSNRNGLMSAEDKAKLDGITAGANKYTHPTSGVTAGTNYNGNQTPAFGTAFNIPKLTFNAQGHITKSEYAQITLPSLGTTATTAAKGNHTHSQYLTSHQDISGKENTSNKTSSWNSSPNNTRYPTEKLVKDSLDSKISKSSTTGLVKNDGTIDTKSYLTQHQSLANYIQKSSTTGLVKNDGTIDTKTYLTSHQDISGKENTSNKVTSISSSSTNSQYPTAKCLYDTSTSLNNTINGNAASYSILVSNTDGFTYDNKIFSMPVSQGNGKLYASVRKNNADVTNGVVLFIVNGRVYPRKINNNNGGYFATLNITLPAGTYNVFVHYVGNGSYDSSGNVIAGSYDFYTYCMDFCQINR